MKLNLKKIKPEKLVKSKNFKIGLVSLIFIVLFFSAKKPFLYLIFLVITGIMTYYKKLYHSPVDFTPLFFLEIVITRYYGFKFLLIFIALGYVVPKLLAGGAMKWDSYAFVSISVICCYISLFMTSLDLQIVGYLTSIIQYIGGVIIGAAVRPLLVAVADGVSNVANNLIWFLIFTDLIVWLFRGI